MRKYLLWLLLQKFPVFDPHWSAETRELWLCIYCNIWRIIKAISTEDKLKERNAKIRRGEAV